ncbi:hypothetical protein LCGC14_0861500 [marine sediment metagenome]|uniref:Uncharacterized protein n=1 Tax=marine sediment metagenome TaxID=412755 RepID=A0A0F9RRW3_9ZZZZ
MGIWHLDRYEYDEDDIKNILEYGRSLSCSSWTEAIEERADVGRALKKLKIGRHWEDVNYTQIVAFLNGGK